MDESTPFTQLYQKWEELSEPGSGLLTGDHDVSIGCAVVRPFFQDRTTSPKAPQFPSTPLDADGRTLLILKQLHRKG